MKYGLRSNQLLYGSTILGQNPHITVLTYNLVILSWWTVMDEGQISHYKKIYICPPRKLGHFQDC